MQEISPRLYMCQSWIDTSPSKATVPYGFAQNANFIILNKQTLS